MNHQQRRLFYLFTGGLDKIEVCIPITSRFANSFYPIYQEARKNGGFKRNPRYFSSLDLRPYGIDAILHEHSRFKDRNGYHWHKLELISVGSMNAIQLIQEVRQVFDEPLSRFKVSRVDFYVDISGITVDDLRARVRLKYKRTSRSYGQTTLERKEIMHNVQTVMLGNGTDVLRYYDKTAERRVQYAKQQRLAKAQSIDTDNFVETFGHSEAALITRIERQLRGRSVPAHLRTLEDLLQNTADFSPFREVEILAGKEQPRLGAYNVHDYLVGRGIAAMMSELGQVETRRRLNKNRNAARLLKKFAEFIPAGDSTSIIPNLDEAFQAAAKDQLQVQAQPDASGYSTDERLAS